MLFKADKSNEISFGAS